MSITYFPKIYEDELVYSVLARYYYHSGFLSSRDAVNELLVNPKLKVDREFIKNVKTEVVEHLTKGISFDELLQRHTMYPYYGRFIGSEKRKVAYDALVGLDGDFSKLFGMPQNRSKEKRYFSYCPVCVQNDRAELGEAYWHRIPQIRGIRVCPYHKCYLVESDVVLDSSISVKLIPAEEIVPLDEVLKKELLYCDNEVEIQLANYIAEVFFQPVDIRNTTTISEFLHFKMMGTPYISVRGEHKYFSRLWSDLKEHYIGLDGIDQLEVGQIQRTLRNGRFVFEEICMIAMFLGISTNELVEMEKPLKSPEQIFDDKVQRLLDDKMSYREIARHLGVSMSMVRLSVSIANTDSRIRKKYSANVNALDWDSLDKEMLPLVEQAIEDLKGNGETRPCRVTVYAISKKLNIAQHRLKNMKMCSKALLSGCDSDEIYMARKIMWGIYEMQRRQLPLKWWRLEHLSKYDRETMMANQPYLEKIAPIEIIEVFESIT